MSTPEILRIVALVAYILAGLCFAGTVALFFAFKIPQVIGDLSGRNARRSIERMRSTNVRSGPKSYKTSKTNNMRGPVTETADSLRQGEGSEETAPLPEGDEGTEPMTGRNFAGEGSEETAPLQDGYEGTVPMTGRDFAGRDETMPLTPQPCMRDSEATMPLREASQEENIEETALLSEAPPMPTGGVELTMLEDIMLIHTNERI